MQETVVPEHNSSLSAVNLRGTHAAFLAFLAQSATTVFDLTGKARVQTGKQSAQFAGQITFVVSYFGRHRFDILPFPPYPTTQYKNHGGIRLGQIALSVDQVHVLDVPTNLLYRSHRRNHLQQ